MTTLSVNAPNFGPEADGESAARRRAVEFGTAWHPANPEPGWLREVGRCDLAARAATAERPGPAFVPRIKAQVHPDPVAGARPRDFSREQQHLSEIKSVSGTGCSDVVAAA